MQRHVAGATEKHLDAHPELVSGSKSAESVKSVKSMQKVASQNSPLERGAGFAGGVCYYETWEMASSYVIGIRRGKRRETLSLSRPTRLIFMELF